MDLVDAFDLRERELVAFVGDDCRIDLMYALAQALAARDRRVVTTSVARLRVPSAEQCEACVSDPETEVAYRDTIERLKYFPHVHTGIGGTGGFVTTRTTGRAYRPSSPELIAALARNVAMPHVLVNAAAQADAKTGVRPATKVEAPEGTTLTVHAADATGLDAPSARERAEAALAESASKADRRMIFLLTGEDDADRQTAREVAAAMTADEGNALARAVIASGTVRGTLETLPAEPDGSASD